MRCPRCETSALVERDRDGILVDICSDCRGVWLDRGELEKLVTRATRELEEMVPHSDHAPARGGRYAVHDEQRRHPKKKRRLIDSLSDIFD